MTEVAPILLPLAEPPRRDRRIVVTAAVSAALHVAVLVLVLLPWAQPTAPAEPQSIAVELVPPSEASSLEAPSLSSAPPSSEPPPSSQASSAESSAAPSAPSSAAQPSEPAPSASSMEPPSSTEPSAASSTPPPPSESSAPPPSGVSSEQPSSAETASGSSAAAPSSASAPSVPPARPVVIPVGQGASSEQQASTDDASASASDAGSEVSSAEASSAPDGPSEAVLAANGDEASAGVDQAGASSGPSDVAALADGPPPPAADLLHAAKRFYLSDMLDQAALAKARTALKQLPQAKRVAQTCNIEAIGQIGNAGKGLSPDAMVANAFAPPAVDGLTYSVSNGAFRSGKKWYGIAYACTLSKDMTAVTAFKFHIGGEVTDSMVARYGKG